MICCPNWRRRMPSRASSGFFSATPKMLLIARIGVHAQQQVGRGKMKEAQGVRLHDLRQTENAAQFVGGGRNADRQQRVAGLGGSDQVADRADAADARHQRRHLVERPAFAELFEAAELGHVKAGVLDAAIFVEVERDLGVPFDAGDRIDHDAFSCFTSVPEQRELRLSKRRLSALNLR